MSETRHQPDLHLADDNHEAPSECDVETLFAGLIRRDRRIAFLEAQLAQAQRHLERLRTGAR